MTTHRSTSRIPTFWRKLYRGGHKSISTKPKLTPNNRRQRLGHTQTLRPLLALTRKNLSATSSGCILYDSKLFIHTQLRKLIMNSIHRNHPGQSGMMHLANLIWFPRIHRESVTLTQNCQPCIKIGKKLKPIITKKTYLTSTTTTGTKQRCPIGLRRPNHGRTPDRLLYTSISR